MRRDIAFATGISVLIPGTADFGVLFVDGVGEIAGVKTESTDHVYATDSRADSNNSDMTKGTNWGISDGIGSWFAGERAIGLCLSSVTACDTID